MTGEAAAQATQQPRARRKPPKVRGLFERPKGSGVWWVRYRDAAGRLHREKAGTRGMALALLDKRRSERRQRAKLPETIRRAAVPMRELLDLAARHVADHYAAVRISARTDQPATDSRYPALAAEFGSRPADQVTPQEIERGLAKLAADHDWRPATINRYKAFLSLAFRLGVENGKIAANPARMVRQRREDNGRIRWLTAEEEDRLRAVIRQDCPEHEPELDLALHTGLRQGNQYSLRWSDVDLARRQIVIGRAKNGRPHYVPINTAALDALLRLKALAGESEWVIVNAETASRYKGKPRRNPRNWFEHCVKRAAIPGFTWHCLRHTVASRLIMAGVDLRTVQELMGHRTVQVTCRYAHLAPKHGLDAAERLVGFGRVQSSTTSSTGPGAPGAERPVLGEQVTIVQ